MRDGDNIHHSGNHAAGPARGAIPLQGEGGNAEQAGGQEHGAGDVAARADHDVRAESAETGQALQQGDAEGEFRE